MLADNNYGFVSFVYWFSMVFSWTNPLMFSQPSMAMDQAEEAPSTVRDVSGPEGRSSDSEAPLGKKSSFAHIFSTDSDD